MNWRKETCANCCYQIKEKCRRFPPIHFNHHSKGMYGLVGTIDSDRPKYPQVRITGHLTSYWENACAEWRLR